MNKRKLAKIALCMSLVCLVSCLNFGLSACSKQGSTDTQSSSSSEQANTQEGFPLTIKNAQGEVTIPKKPERVVTIAWANHDTPLALGIAPVGVSAANFGLTTQNKLHPWTDEAFKNLGVEQPRVFNDLDGSIDFEAVADAKPDVILSAYSGMSDEDYAKLNKIAPVVSYADKPWQTLWRDQVKQNAAALGLSKEAKELIDSTDKLIAEKIAQYPNLAGKKAAFFWVSADDMSKFFVYLPSDPRAAFLTDLGFKFPDSVKALAQNAEDFSVTISRENADKLSDIELLITYGDEKLLKAMQADPLMCSIPAIKNGAVALIDGAGILGGASTPSVLSIPATIDEYLHLLNEAAGNIK